MHTRPAYDNTPDSLSSLSIDTSSPREPALLSSNMTPNFFVTSPSPIPVRKLYNSILAIQEALDNGLQFELQEDCTGGTYFCLNLYGGVEGVFKPFDEEPYCDLNPKGLDSSKFTSAVNRGIRPGTSGLREVAAFYLDHNHDAGVPETILTSLTTISPFTSYCSSSSLLPSSLSIADSILTKNQSVVNLRKDGSLQLYIEHTCSSEDYGPTMFSVANVQHIALFDMRLLNLDRHANNLLVTRERLRSPSTDTRLLGESRSSLPSRRAMSTYTEPSRRDLVLIPIDHGYSLPVCSTTALPEWCWRSWYQCCVDLEDTVRESIRSFCVEEDISLLRNNLPWLEEDVFNTLRVTTLWLQLAEKAGFSLYQMSCFFFPEEDGMLSGFQQAVGICQRHRYSCKEGCEKNDQLSFDEILQSAGKEYMNELISSML